MKHRTTAEMATSKALQHAPRLRRDLVKVSEWKPLPNSPRCTLLRVPTKQSCCKYRVIPSILFLLLLLLLITFPHSLIRGEKSRKTLWFALMYYKILFTLSFAIFFVNISALNFRSKPPKNSIGMMTFFPIPIFSVIPSYFNSFFGWYNPHAPQYDDSDSEFMLRTFKVKQCPNRFPHCWVSCPYTHHGERVKRRDPYKFRYNRQMCRWFRICGKCHMGDNCRFAHGIYEIWFHPSKYRTRMCNMGHACRRPLCFFAHTAHQRRQPLNLFQNQVNSVVRGSKEYNQAILNPTVDWWGEYFWWSFFNSATNEDAPNEQERRSDRSDMLDIDKLIMENYPLRDTIREFFDNINRGEGFKIKPS